jgi:hypothetical protein
MKSSRRTFILQTAGVATALGLSRTAFADIPALSESDPTASALGYKADATKVDKAKFPKYAAGEQCANCVLYQGKPGDASGPCPIYAGKAVSSKGWCSSYSKKP